LRREEFARKVGSGLAPIRVVRGEISCLLFLLSVLSVSLW